MSRKQKLYHYIYRTTCQITGKFYVGMHSTDNLEDGYLGSGKILGYSRKKHGDENHKREILEMCPSREALKLREKEIVNETLLANPLNINLKYGGEGGGLMSEKNKTNGFHAKGGIAANVIRRTRFRAKMQDPAFREWYGQCVSSGMQGLQNFLGKTHTPESREQMSMSHQGKHDGNKNSQFGTCWVCNVDGAKKIPKEQLDEYLVRGFVRGRKVLVIASP